MKRLMALVLVAAVTVLVLLFFSNPQLLDKLWLWMVGLAGYILILLERGFKSLSGLFEGKKAQPPQPPPPASPLPYGDLHSKIEKMEGRLSQIESKLTGDNNL